MAHEISAGPHPYIVIDTLTGEYVHADMVVDEKMALDAGHAVYVLLDASGISNTLPENFLDGARNSFFIHPNMAHMALYTRSGLLRTVGNMVAKLTRRRDKLTIYDNYEAALSHLLKLVKEAGL